MGKITLNFQLNKLEYYIKYKFLNIPLRKFKKKINQKLVKIKAVEKCYI